MTHVVVKVPRSHIERLLQMVRALLGEQRDSCPDREPSYILISVRVPKIHEESVRWYARGLCDGNLR